MRERVRVRGKSWVMQHCYPLIRPSATFSLREKELALIRCDPRAMCAFVFPVLVYSI
jgi:hypothetical protein